MEDVRGQAEPKEEVSRVVRLWQSGEEFEKAGGKRERGLLFLGAPGTGKTMLAKAIATNFNCPFVTIPGSGFAATFIGIDVIVVMWLIRKAKRLARKWGGQCIVFIDEIDAVGMRRASLGPGAATGMGLGTQSIEDYCFFGPWGALTPTGDLILETRAWRERLFAERADQPVSRIPPILAKPAELVQRYMFPGGMGGGFGGQALNQLLVQMDGIGEAPFLRRFVTNRVNTLLDASYLVPRKRRQALAAAAAPAARHRAGVLHRRHQRADRPARPGADPPRPDGPPRLVPHAHARGPQGHLQPVPGQGRPRARPRHRAPARRAGPDHQRLLAGDDRAGLLAGADLLPRRRPAVVRLVGHRRGDDDRRGRHRRRHRLHPGGDPRGGDPRGRPRRQRPPVHEGRPLHPPLDPQAGRIARPPPGDRDAGAVLLLAQRRVLEARLDARRDGGRARVLRRELDRRRRRRDERHRPGRVDGRHVRDGSEPDRPQRPVCLPGGRRRRAREADGALRGHRRADHEPGRQRRAVRAESDRRRARRPRQAKGGERAPRPGVRDRIRHGGRQPRAGRADRRGADPAQGDARRRGGRPAQQRRTW